jgi:hypothetical protein
MSGSALILRRAKADRNGDAEAKEDYQVFDQGRAVGRMYATSGGLRGTGYCWFIYGTSTHGSAATRVEAMTQWKAAYQARR